MRRRAAAALFDRWTCEPTRARGPAPGPVPRRQASRRSAARRRVRRSCADLPDRWPCVRLERVTHGCRGVVQPGRRGPGRDPKGRGRLLERESEVQPEDERRAVLDGESLKAWLELLAHGHVVGAIADAGLRPQDADDRAVPPDRPELFLDGTQQEPVQPGVEPGGIAQRGQVAPASYERLLHRILGALHVAQDQSRNAVQAIDDEYRYPVERVPVAGAGPDHGFDVDLGHRVSPVAVCVVRMPYRRDFRGIGSIFASARGPACQTPCSMVAILGGLGAALSWAIATLASSRSSRMISPISVLGWVMAVGLATAIVPALVARPIALDLPMLTALVLVGVSHNLGLP